MDDNCWIEKHGCHDFEIVEVNDELDVWMMALLANVSPLQMMARSPCNLSGVLLIACMQPFHLKLASWLEGDHLGSANDSNLSGFCQFGIIV